MSNLSDFYSSGSTSTGGVTWSIETTNKTTVAGKAYLMDCSSSAKTVTLHNPPVVGDTVAIGDLYGNFAINNCTINSNSLKIMGTVQNLTLDVKNQRITLVYTGATNGWDIVELEPNNSQFEYVPNVVMHVREQQASGTNGGASIAGTQTRVLNTVVMNDIVGASLNSNQITLPAGTYEFDVLAPVYQNTLLHKLRLYNVTDSSYVMEGRGSSSSSTNLPDFSRMIGVLTLASTKVFEVRHYTQNIVATNGLGVAVSQGNEVYTECKITKIGGNYAPRIVTPNLMLQPIAGLDTTGNIQGFDVTKTGANQLTVTKGVCWDNTMAVVLSLTSDTPVTIPSAVNTIYHLFVCRLVSNGNITVRAYTSEAAAAADTATINAFRWIGYWVTNGLSNCRAGLIKDGELWWERFAENTINSSVAVPAGITTAIDISSFLPVSRAGMVVFSGVGPTTNQFVAIGSVSGTPHSTFNAYHTDVSSGGVGEWGPYYSTTYMPLAGSNIYWGRGVTAAGSNVQLGIHAVKLRR